MSKPVVTIVSPDVTIGWEQHVQISPVISMDALAIKTAIGFTVQYDLRLKLKEILAFFKNAYIFFQE